MPLKNCITKADWWQLTQKRLNNRSKLSLDQKYSFSDGDWRILTHEHEVWEAQKVCIFPSAAPAGELHSNVLEATISFCEHNSLYFGHHSIDEATYYKQHQVWKLKYKATFSTWCSKIWISLCFIFKTLTKIHVKYWLLETWSKKIDYSALLQK